MSEHEVPPSFCDQGDEVAYADGACQTAVIFEETVQLSNVTFTFTFVLGLSTFARHATPLPHKRLS